MFNGVVCANVVLSSHNCPEAKPLTLEVNHSTYLQGLNLKYKRKIYPWTILVKTLPLHMC